MTRTHSFLTNELYFIEVDQNEYSAQLRRFARRGYYYLFAILSLLLFNHVSYDASPLWIAFLVLSYQFIVVYTLLLRVDGTNIRLCSIAKELTCLDRQVKAAECVHPLASH